MNERTFKENVYNSQLERGLKKNYLDILRNPSGFIRGISETLSKDLLIIKGEKLPPNPDIETIERIKYICEYSLSKMSNRRRKQGNNPNIVIEDNFSKYERALEWVKKHQ